MQCPVCDVTLSISSREGVEIDFCPQCRGVWLDRGELDKVIERASAAMAGAAPRAVGDPDRARYEDRPRERDRHRGDDRRRDSGEHRRYDSGEHRRYSDSDYRKRKKRSFLDDLFDFD